MKYRTILVAGIATALPAGAAIAGDKMEDSAGAASAQTMTALDADGNGELSQEEVAGTELEARFATLDADGNGAISEEEFKAGSGIGGPESGADSMEESGTSGSGSEY